MKVSQMQIGGGQQLKTRGVDSGNIDSFVDSVDSAQNAPAFHTHSAEQIFICPIASSLSRLRGLEEFKGDFIELDSELTKDKVLDFYTQDFYKACDYCHDMWEKKRGIPVAIQTKEVFKLEK